MPDITDAQADALGAVLSEGMDPAYLARVADFSDEQIAAGELRAADAEAERLNRDLYRRAIAAALEVRAREAHVTERFLSLAEALTIAGRPDGVPSIVKDDALRVLADTVTQLQGLHGG